MIHEGFKALIHLGKEKFNPNILIKELEKMKLKYLADEVVRVLCKKYGYPVTDSTDRTDKQVGSKVEDDLR